MVVAETVAAAKDGAERVDDRLRGAARASPTRVDAASPVHRACTMTRDSNVCIDARGRRRRGDRGGLRARRACREVRDLGPARHRRADGAARGGRRIRPRDRTLHDLRRQRPALRLRKDDLAIVLDVPDGRRARRHARRRRQFRHPRHDLSRVQPLVAWAARRIGRPVKWTCDRSEAFLSDYQGRDLAVEAELALDARQFPRDARLQHQQCRRAHRATSRRCRRASRSCRASTGCRPRISAPAACVSNTSPTRPYRSAGRPEVMYRHGAADRSRRREFGFDRVELRRRNLVAAAELPYTQSVRHDLRQRRLSRRHGLGARACATGTAFRRAQGRGARAAASCAASASPTMSTPRPASPRERAEITVQPDGRVDVVIGTVLATARATRRASPSWSTSGSACRSTTCASSPATPTS